VDRRVAWFGETAILVEPLPSEDLHSLAEALRAVDGVDDVLPGSVVLVRAGTDSIESVRDTVSSIPEHRTGGHTAERTGRVVDVPVVFDGPDLAEIAFAAGTTEQGVLEMICGAELRVAYLGFSPGFPYIVGLPEQLTRLRRRSVPRTMVAAGSVAIAAGYLGIYPQSSPGGWNLAGRTGLQMFDPHVAPYAALQPGDAVRVVPGDPASLTAAPGSDPSGGSDRPRCASLRRLVVEAPGTLTTLQDSGRRGVGHLGVPRAGPGDPDLMRLANLVVGNDPGAGVLETTLDGPVLRFDSPVHLVVVGAALAVDGRALDPGAVVPVRSGDLVEVGRSHGLHGYVAVCGGIWGPRLFGSCSSDLLSGLGIGPLRARDELALGEPGRPRGYAAPIERNPTIRVLANEGFGVTEQLDLLAELTSGTFTVAPESNRVGVRLKGERPVSAPGVSASRQADERGDMVGGAHLPHLSHLPGLLGSYGMVEGAVQVPPSGEPIVLGCDHATMGGYPVIATVITADIGSVAQRMPGDTVRFEVVDLDYAREARAALDRQLARGPVGRFPTSAGE
jgi:KipI family sensor histidine kinase inhibitor